METVLFRSSSGRESCVDNRILMEVEISSQTSFDQLPNVVLCVFFFSSVKRDGRSENGLVSSSLLAQVTPVADAVVVVSSWMIIKGEPLKSSINPPIAPNLNL